MRRVVQLDAEREAREASTRVDAIPSRVRAPLAVRVAPPGVMVLSLPLEAVERHVDGVDGVLRETLLAIPPGWTYARDPEARADAIACARHQATLRGDELVLLEDLYDVGAPVVAVGRRNGPPARILALAVVRFSRLP